MSAHRDSLSAALARAEEFGRPGLPDAGFSVGRANGHDHRAVYRSNGSLVIAPEGHLHRITPAPDGRLIAAEWAPEADENAVLAIIDVAAGEMRVHPEIRLRYDSVLWDAASRRLDVVASRDDRIVSLDVHTGETETTPTEPGVRTRLFPGGRTGLLSRRSAVEGKTVLVDRASDRRLGCFRALFRALPLGDGILVWHDGGIEGLDADGGSRWLWDDPRTQIVDVAVREERVLVLVVREGRSVLLDLVDGAVVRAQELSADSDTVSAGGIGLDGAVLRVAVEGPVTPPRIVEADPFEPLSVESSFPGATTVRQEIQTDDGADIVVHVTAMAGGSDPRPLILTCYGGFGIPFLPAFEPTIPAWLAHGGVYATAQVRGGGEHGVQWREAGSGANKHRAITDLAAVARALVRSGITRSDLLVFAGASLGGVVVASCALAHPDICRGVVTTAAPLDLLGLDHHPLGALWKAEFGDDGTPEARERLRRISPLALAEAMPEWTAAPEFLGIVLEKDTRVLALDTSRTVDALERAGITARLWTAADAGHGSNDLQSLHELGLTVLDFAARLTMERGA